MTDRRRFTYVPLLISESIMQGKLTHIQARVLLALFHHYNPKLKIPVFPSRGRLSKMTGIHPSTISKATKHLEEEGYITKKYGVGKSVRYTLNPEVVDLATSDVAESATLTDQRTRASLGYGVDEKPCAVPKAGASGGDNGDSASRRGQISDGEFCDRIVESHKDCPF